MIVSVNHKPCIEVLYSLRPQNLQFYYLVLIIRIVLYPVFIFNVFPLSCFRFIASLSGVCDCVTGLSVYPKKKNAFSSFVGLWAKPGTG